MDETVEVVSVSSGFELEKGEKVVYVVFGKYLKVTEEIKKRLPQTQRDSVGNEIISSSFTLFYKPTGAADNPYQVGSKWNLKIDNNGEMSIKKAKGEK